MVGLEGALDDQLVDGGAARVEPERCRCLGAEGLQFGEVVRVGPFGVEVRGGAAEAPARCAVVLKACRGLGAVVSPAVVAAHTS